MFWFYVLFAILPRYINKKNEDDRYFKDLHFDSLCLAGRHLSFYVG